MLEGEPEPPRSTILHALRVALQRRRPASGSRPARPATQVERGTVIGEVRDLYGDTLQTITAPDDGVVLFLTTSAAVEANGLLLGLGCER